MLHGDESAHERTIFCGENTNKHDFCSSTSYLISFQLVVIIMGEGVTPLLHVCQDHCNSDVS